MAYSVYGDVQSEFKDLDLSSTTKIKDTEVTQFIVESDAYIDGRLSKKYVTPITGTEALKIVKTISIKLTACRVWGILEVATKEKKDRGKALCKEALDMIDQILSDNAKELELTDAVLNTTDHGIVASNYENDIDPIFEKETDQW